MMEIQGSYVGVASLPVDQWPPLRRSRENREVSLWPPGFRQAVATAEAKEKTKVGATVPWQKGFLGPSELG